MGKIASKLEKKIMTVKKCEYFTVGDTKKMHEKHIFCPKLNASIGIFPIILLPININKKIITSFKEAQISSSNDES